MIEQDKKEEELWLLVDVEAMSTFLAKHDYEQETGTVPTEDMYKVGIVEKPEGLKVEKDIHEQFSTLFWNLKQMWLALIKQFAKDDTE